MADVSSCWPFFRGNSRNTGESKLKGPTSPSLIWKVPFTGVLGGVILSTSSSESNNNFIVGTSQTQLYSLNTAGSILWTSDIYNCSNSISGSTTSSMMPVFRNDGSILYSTLIGDIYVLSSSGSVLWSFFIKSLISSPPTIDINGTSYHGTDSVGLLAIDFNGNLKWQYNIIGANFTSPPAIDENNGNIYFSAQSNGVNQENIFNPSLLGYYGCLNSFGSLVWLKSIIHDHKISYKNTNFGDDVNDDDDEFNYVFSYDDIIIKDHNDNLFFSPIIGSNDNIYFTFGAFVLSISPTGSELWKSSMNQEQKNNYVVQDMGLNSFSNTLIVPCSDSNLYAFNAFTGLLEWSISLSGFFLTAPTISSADGSIYISSSDGYLNSISYSGSIQWKIQISSDYFDFQSVCSSITIGHENFIYVTVPNSNMENNNSSYLFAIGNEVSNSISNSNIISIIIGVTVSGSVLFILIFILFYFYVHKKKKKKNISSRSLELPDIESLSSGSFSSTSKDSMDARNKIQFMKSFLNSETGLSINQGYLSPKKIKNINELSPIVKNDLRIPWENISIGSKNKNKIILHQSISGSVIRATLKSSIGFHDVVVKIVSKSILQNNNIFLPFREVSKNVYDKVVLIASTESKLLEGSKYIIKTYGLAVGELPLSIIDLLNLSKKEEAVGIVLRYESGGTLENFIHDNNEKKISFLERLRLLTEVSRALSSIHSINLVNGHIKSSNILLSDKDFLHIRLSSFGSSYLSENKRFENNFNSNKTDEISSIYCAPEIISNPLFDQEKVLCHKYSNKTDMYAFGLLVWEVLSNEKPFNEFKSESSLCAAVHQGFRPDLSKLPSETPQAIIDLITCCWSSDRSQRKSSSECFAILNTFYMSLANDYNKFDAILLSTPQENKFVSSVYYLLTERGFRSRIISDRISPPLNLVKNSQCLIVFVCKNFHDDAFCMSILLEAIKFKRIIATIILENGLVLNDQEELKEALLDTNQLVPINMGDAYKVFNEINEFENDENYIEDESFCADEFSRVTSKKSTKSNKSSKSSKSLRRDEDDSPKETSNNIKVKVASLVKHLRDQGLYPSMI